jgi:hypothetical protein
MWLAASCLLLLFLSGNALAQDGRYVIKKKFEEGDGNTKHYLAHVKVDGNWVLQDATSFSPACLWISDNTYCPGGNNKNYYFYDDNNTPRFLASPEFEVGGSLTLSTTVPTGSDLGTPEYQYYFYRWDSGLGRGVQYFGVTSETCAHEWKWMDEEHTKGECWEVYWVSYDSGSNTWKLSDMHYGLEDVHYGARYHSVAITEHSQDTTTSSGGLEPLSGFSLEWEGSPQTISPSITTPYSYRFTPAYTEYVVNESYYGHEPNPINVPHNYWGGEDHGDAVPIEESRTEDIVYSRYWTITGDAAEYLSFSDVAGSNVTTSNADAPTLYYSTQNTTGDKTATLKLVVTYGEHGEGARQTRMATVTVLTPCQNPAMNGAPEVTETGVTLSWYPTATSYMVSWQKAGASSWNSVSLGNVTSYTIRGLDFATTYNYELKATSCSTTGEPTSGNFTTLEEPEGLVLFGAIFGGGRMADVNGKTEVVIINASDINAVFGGNDIAGKVNDENGSTITLGVDADDPHDYDDYGTTNATINIGSVYGGGNGYYAYNGSSFVPATNTYISHEVAANGGHVNAMTPSHEVGEVVWTNNDTEPKTLDFPTIAKTNITVTNDYVKVDSLFGGAKNAFLTNTTNDVNITINGGTLFTVFGGNNFGGTLGEGSQEHIVVNNTLTKTTEYHGLQLGRDFGIGYLFGGGNKVEGQNVQIDIFGGQMDTIFGGGNAADVLSTQLTVNCALAAGTSGPQFGKVFSNAITACSGESPNFTLTINENYNWECSGIYNIRTLFGGNNKATMAGLPDVILTSGSIGTVYGGGNAGDMHAAESGSIIFDDLDSFAFNYSTHVVMNSPTMLVDFLYGGCQMSNVLYSTWVELKKGHVGTVYGGCNISGDVGSTRVNQGAPHIPTVLEDQEVYGGTYVKAGGADDDNVIVYNNLIAGSNGYYDCSQDGIHYKGDDLYDDPTGKYDGLEVPTHNETHAIISKGARIKRNVYAGGNLACVGFDDETGFYRGFPELIGLASLRMDGGMVDGNVYGGSNLASIYGINEVRVSGGTIGLALYGGNDCSGQVAEKTNRLLPDDYTVASDGVTSLTALGVKTYVGVKGNPQINTVYGGGNGAYAPGEVEYCYSNFEPVQSYTFVDIHIDGGSNPGHIGTVYGGGNGVTVRHGVTVFFNIQSVDETDSEHVDVIFGGNNKGDLDVVSDIILLHGKVGTVYGGCNQGAMIATDRVKTIGDYSNVGSYVRLLDSYPGLNGTTVVPDAKVTEAIYGGCRMNGVTSNSLVLVDHGDFRGTSIFGGSDISGFVRDTSIVAVTGGFVGDVYGGGNGGYYYVEDGTTGEYTVYKDAEHTQLLATGIGGAPSCNYSGADIWGGHVGTDASHKGQVFGGGYGQLTVTNRDVIVNIGDAEATSAAATPIIYGDIYGGSALGNVNFPAVGYHTTVNFMNGTLKGNLYGGGLGQQQIGEDPATAIAAKSGGVYVTISSADQNEANCFIDLRQANIFGCNNANGSPQDDVEVHVWKTGYTTGDYDSQSGTFYAIDQVFGGGNQADYAPQNGSASSTKKTKVYVHDCVNTIRRVFSGGNAAAAIGVVDTIQGGRFEYVFGGGNGEDEPANIGAGGTNLVVEAGIIEHLFGGSNLQGSITGPVNTVINGNNKGVACAEDITEFFGGSNQASLQNNVNSVIECGCGSFNEIYGGSKLADIEGDVTLTIRGGTCTGEGSGVYGGSKGQAGDDDDDAADITGKVVLNIEGGAITNAFGGSNINGNITDDIVVNVIDFEGECGLDLTNVYGGGNVTAYTPTDATITSPVVNVIHIAQTEGIKGNVFGGAKGATATVSANPQVNFGYNAATMSVYLPEFPQGYTFPDSPRAYVSGNVFGGGDQAAVGTTGEGAVICNTEVNVYNGEIVKKLVGGGNEAGVLGNVTVNISGGLLCTSASDYNVGIYGGCNTSGTVGGNTLVNITGTNETETTIGSYDAVLTKEGPTNVHGGGYGETTSVLGNVTVNFGSLSDPESEYPKLFGDLYGGSALGNVNDEESDLTTVNLLNGSIVSVTETVNNPGQTSITYYYSGNVYGGGLGRKDDPATNDNEAVEAKVFGTVHVNIGKTLSPPSSDLDGMVTLIGCNVYGCNNQNGTPKYNVYVDVYKTAHTTTNQVNGNDYAILHVFGGGNEAHYEPADNNVNKRTHVYVHGCENTIKYVYGGGNAADALGVQSIIEGGRFSEVYGGGNGLVTPANIGEGSIGFIILGGHLNYLFEGNNKAGEIGGTPYVPNLPEGYIDDCGELIVDSYYFGDNEAEHIGDIVNTIPCEQASNFDYKYVYAGSRWAVIYGDVKLTVQGGNIRYLFGGSKGYMDESIPADVRRFPSYDEIQADISNHEDPKDRKYSQALLDHMGYPDNFNTDLVHKGGNIELIVNGGTIGEVIGGCDELGTVEGKITVIIDEMSGTSCPLHVGNVYGAGYRTDVVSFYSSPDDDPTPKVSIIKGTIGGTFTFGYDPSHPEESFNGDVYGGGNFGSTTSNPLVVVGDGTTGATATSVTINGNVYGGGEEGDVTGSSRVVVVPETHKLTMNNTTQTGGTYNVAYTRGTAVSNNDQIGEDVDLRIVATPTTANATDGYLFSSWTVSGTGARIDNPSSAKALFTMGTTDASLSASFIRVDPHELTLVANPSGAATFKVDGADCAGMAYVAQGATVTVEAIHQTGYVFDYWEATGTTVSSTQTPVTTFVVGTSIVTLTAHFIPTLTMTVDPDNSGTLKMNNLNYNHPVSIPSGTGVIVEAIPEDGYTFVNWTENGTVVSEDPSFTFTSTGAPVSLTAHFTQTGRRANNNRR